MKRMNRTKYKSTIRLTARERSAVKRWVAPPYRPLSIGDKALCEGVLRRVLNSSKKEAHGKGTNRGP